ncbi:hypothetical protein BCR42DRAFT_403120 [Absidia repens]|uniref:Uncharacterized protein n=1 Tax=Absidia repens TaxID=90262 RepID=A0A1X2IZ09_9FUNG|nr:hypothetical protein BCR42DRAFT_403120 [Absidia repens]
MELRNHVKKHMSQQQSASDDENASDDEAASTPIAITNSAPLSKLTLIDKNSNKTSSRNYSDATLFATNELYAPDVDKIKTLHIIDKLNVVPFSLSHNGVEQTALANKAALEKLITKHQHDIRPIIPSKKPFDPSPRLLYSSSRHYTAVIPFELKKKILFPFPLHHL